MGFIDCKSAHYIKLKRCGPLGLPGVRRFVEWVRREGEGGGSPRGGPLASQGLLGGGPAPPHRWPGVANEPLRRFAERVALHAGGAQPPSWGPKGRLPPRTVPSLGARWDRGGSPHYTTSQPVHGIGAKLQEWPWFTGSALPAGMS